jgi:hypothetical protein
MAFKKIFVEKITIGNKCYDMYHIEYKGKIHKVASYRLHNKVVKMLENDCCNSLANHIDSLYDVYIPRGVKKMGENEIIKSAIDAFEELNY